MTTGDLGHVTDQYWALFVLVPALLAMIPAEPGISPGEGGAGEDTASS